MTHEMQTDRLLLRQWKEEDRQPFSALNNDPLVMRYFPRTFTQAESDRFIDEQIKHLSLNDWGAWAVECLETGEFIGFVGFSRPAPWHPCAGNIDVGWRLGRRFWGHGYATEAARQALQVGFESIGFDQVVAFTSRCNLPSLSVMRKIGMQLDAEGFLHPRIENENPLRDHAVYRLSRTEWQAINAQDNSPTN